MHNNIELIFFYLYLFTLASFTGYEVISRIPVILHTPLMSGSNFIHGIILIGAMIALGHSVTYVEKIFGFIGVIFASSNAIGGFFITSRMLKMFKSKSSSLKKGE